METKTAVLRESGLAQPYAVSKPLTIENLELKRPGRGEVLIQIKAASLCHSDLSVINGSRPRPLPMALGHEAAGIVKELGEGVTDLQVGDHVVCVFVPSCGHC
ncbi:alcohol dehydrogenase catalytic domain-containing protein, partial [Virgibacillus salexigens]|uniref:alcohol dehydrogenase catalytic domain-containing protein n=1 Tax=Virgibacillus salexigens TaxID=61016 RepID=UPI00308209E9